MPSYKAIAVKGRSAGAPFASSEYTQEITLQGMESAVGRNGLVFHTIVLIILGAVSLPVFAVSVTISKASAQLNPDAPSDEVRLISGPEPLEYRVELVDAPEGAGRLMWSPKRLIVPAGTSIPLRFAYNPEAFQQAGDHLYTFHIRARAAPSSTPLRNVDAEASNQNLASNEATARVALEPALEFKVLVSNSE